ncbi:MAG: sodium:solute symporter family protein [Planctomycetia bacterium]|nr:sodium:solute symporter family protein [Planctomycetia bacterium]
MTLTALDYLIIFFFFALTLAVGLFVMKKAGSSSSEFFLSGRSMPWWLLGFSMVATTFSAGTPNLVTDIVRQHGIAGNWVWWAFLLTGMTTVFIYAKLWRRLGVLTDIEFYEVRYSGRSGAFLRGFRAIYLGLLVNTVTMATATLAIVKILSVVTGTSPVYSIIGASVITVAFSALGGFAAVLWTDFILFIVAMGGAIAVMVVALGRPEVGGLSGLLANDVVRGHMSFFPDMSDTPSVLSLLIVPLAVQWWSTWYPGSEPGGGSYTAQRMLAAKNERHAVGATLFFNICHYAVRPWAWLLVALASLICFPTLESIQEAFPNVPDGLLGHDIAYPAMLTYLPTGWAGLVLASLFAAYMSTISTHLNLGASYMVNDWYQRFYRPDATQEQLVRAGRWWTVLLMVLAGAIVLCLKNALAAFQILMLIGAGTGLLFLLRWFWWRINAYSEIAAMVISFLVAIYLQFLHIPLFTTVAEDGTKSIPDWLNFSDAFELILAVGITTVGWIVVTLLTPPVEKQTLRAFLKRSRAGGPGWKRVIDEAARDGDPIPEDCQKWSVPSGIFCSVVGCTAVYAALFGTGCFIYGNTVAGSILTAVFVVGMLVLIPFLRR